MKKTGEKVKSFSIHALFVVLVVAGLFFIASKPTSLTGYAAFDPETAKTKLETALASSASFGAISSSNICVVIQDPEQPVSLSVFRSAGTWTVTETTGFCNGLDNEDLVVQFPDYDSFSRVTDNPAPRNLASAAKNQEFQVLPSKYVESGGNVLCDAIFRAQYCSALVSMGSVEELIEADLSCCIDDFTRSQRKLLEQHLATGNYKDEQGVLESPGGLAGLPISTSMIVLVGVVIVVLFVIIAAVVMHKPKLAAKPAAGALGAPGAAAKPGMPGLPGASPTIPSLGGFQTGMQTGIPGAQPAEDPGVTELRQYVQGALIEGYPYDEIRAHLLQIGWDPATADRVLYEAQSINQQQR